MVEISKSQEVKAPIESVWKLISDLDNEHKNWSMLKDVKITSRTENSIERQVKIRRGPMGEAKSVQNLSIDPSKRLTMLTLTDGPMIGTRKIILTKLGAGRTKIDVNWDFDMKGIPGFAKGFASDSVAHVTDNALEEIAKEAEAMQK